MTRWLRMFPLLCLPFPVVALPASTSAQKIDPQVAKHIDADVQAILQRTGTPGATILVAGRGRVIYRHAYGWRDREHHEPASFEKLVSYIAGKPLDFPSGSHWSYSNTGYLLAGRVIEVVSHETYRHYIQTHLLDRAGMTHTFTVADESKLPDMAIGYDRGKGRIERARTIAASVGWAAGFLVSTVDDLQKWNLALRGGRIVSPADYAQMSTSVKTQQGHAGYGLGLFVDNIDGQPRVGHTGGSLGFTTANEYFPRQLLQVIAYTNFVDNPEPGETITTAIFEDMNPAIAAAAMRPAPGEDPSVPKMVGAYFVQMQAGDADSPYLAGKLKKKMQAGLARRLGGEFNGYGKPTAFVYKGKHVDAGVTFHDYVIRFGPGSMLKFGVALDKAGKISSISFG